MKLQGKPSYLPGLRRGRPEPSGFGLPVLNHSKLASRKTLARRQGHRWAAAELGRRVPG
ncbi:hypothetical protein MPLDJ20_120128 [Mesorhizobium plurifarium]|uniref:Uncharacterized protein n=1 Tax=Mesorhizobium plurifarium TaxID=69974 RepID=A0A090GUY6_MESPL|nr:hypothetical protein MPLDJ20_120128 [Mesorhizobium plurifarium]CDX58174.1 hypothetical protein MPL3365_30006 [Mesorhizobium plurifarium]